MISVSYQTTTVFIVVFIAQIQLSNAFSKTVISGFVMAIIKKREVVISLCT